MAPCDPLGAVLIVIAVAARGFLWPCHNSASTATRLPSGLLHRWIYWAVCSCACLRRSGGLLVLVIAALRATIKAALVGPPWIPVSASLLLNAL